MGNYRNLDVWQFAHKLAISVHAVAVKIRGSNYVSLRSQIIRAAISIPANIVEGREQESDKDFRRFLRYSVGSASELEYHLLLARDLHLLTENDCRPLEEQIERVRKMLHGLINGLTP